MEELDEIFIRNEIRKILNEQTFGVTFGDIVPPSADQFYKAFIGPFVDVFKVAQVAVKDVASATLTTIESALTFDTKKQQELLGKFRQDRDKYKSEMSKALESSKAALSSPDAQLIMFMMNPGAYLGAGLATEVKNTAEPVTEFIASKLGPIGAAMGYEPAQKAQDDKGPIRGILDDMKKLFFGHTTEGLDEIDDLERILREGEEEEEKPAAEGEVQEEIDKWLEDSGAGGHIKGYAESILTQKKAEVEEVKKQRIELIESLNAVAKVESFEELATLIPKVAQGGIDLTEQAKEVEKAAQEQKDILKKGGEEADKMIEDLKKTPDGKSMPSNAAEEDWFALVDKGVLAAAFAEVVTKAKEQSVGQLLGFVAEMTREELAELAKTGPLGKQYAELIIGLENDLLSI